MRGHGMQTIIEPKRVEPDSECPTQESFIADAWYVAMPAKRVHPGRSRTIKLFGRDMEINRGHNGELTVKGALPNTRVVDQQDLIWLYNPCPLGQVCADPAPPPLNVPSATVRYCATVTIPASQDDAVYGLLDPAHTPFVHKSPLWRGSGKHKLKKKLFEPLSFGWRMAGHKPVNSDIYKLIGGQIGVHIDFELPGIRAEYIQNSKHTVLGLTALTPIDEHNTQLNHIFYWNSPILSVLRPIVPFFTKGFLQQDVYIMALRSTNLSYGGRGMLVGDSDRQFQWYMKLKREWQNSRKDRRDFVNDLKPETLYWRT
jgi:phenylpropionate dioxygenase-like ring-hydroxylating dioxygenase large terminal subunit